MTQTACGENARDIFWRLQNAVIQMIGDGMALHTIADFICRQAEQAAANEVMCSILAVGADERLRTLSAPNLPAKYSRALNGLKIGPNVGSCGAAAYLGREVTTVDLHTHPNWAAFQNLASLLNVKACWSSPIRSRAGNVIGTFAFYFKSNPGPTSFERELVACCTQLCAIAIENEKTRTQLLSLVYRDPLTSLRNRNGYLDDLSKFARGTLPFALILLDLNDLKGINDSLSHAAGDALIRAVGARLAALGDEVTSYRLGGDEFGVLVPGCESESRMAQWAAAILEGVNQPVDFQGNTLNCYVTAGGVFSNPPADAEELAQNADLALYHGKATRRGGFVPFELGMRTAITRRLNAVSMVDQALREGRVMPFYQPLVKLETSEIIGLEALARIRNIDGSVLAAKDFQEAFSESRLAHMVTDAIMNTVAVDLRVWLDRGIPFQHVGVNVTSADFHRGDLDTRITAAFASQNVPLKHLVLEVSEAVFMGSGGDSSVAASVERLRQKHMLVALDDFGTGYASLTHLLEFPVDVIKIDQTFVQRLCDDRGSQAIVGALIEIAGKLGMRIVAEGIETREQAEQLHRMGCTLGQGYYYSGAVSFAETTTLLSHFSQDIAAPASAAIREEFSWPPPILG